MKNFETDIMIVGAGLTGLMTAYALSSLRNNIILVDKSKFYTGIEIENKKDVRTTAIAEGSKIFLEKIKIWNLLSKFAEPINKINVIDRTEHTNIKFINPNSKKKLGYIIKNSILKKTILNKIKKIKNIKFLENFDLSKLSYENNHICALSKNILIKSSIVIAADGKNSSVQKIIKTKTYKKNYQSSATVINFNHTKNHFNIAHELFYNTGPIAILPMFNKGKKHFSSSVIWTSSNNDNFSFNLIKNESIIAGVLEEKIFKFVGSVKKIYGIQKFPLSAHINQKFYEKRIIYLGDSAHSIHPIAGQGWNLGLRDIENCFNNFNRAKELGLDLGSDFVCKAYNDLSYYDAYSLYQITDKLNLIFLKDDLVTRNIRKFGFKLIDNSIKIKNYITNYAMGVN